MQLIAYDEHERPHLPVAIAVAAVALAGVIGAGGVATWHAMASASPAKPPAGVLSSRTPTACLDAVAAADAAVRDARTLESALATQTRTMNDLLAKRITLQQALDQTLPGLAAASRQSGQLDQDAAAYDARAKGCRSR